MKISKVTLENYKQFFRAKIKFLLRNEIELVLGSNVMLREKQLVSKRYHGINRQTY